MERKKKKKSVQVLEHSSILQADIKKGKIKDRILEMRSRLC